MGASGELPSIPEMTTGGTGVADDEMVEEPTVCAEPHDMDTDDGLGVEVDKDSEGNEQREKLESVLCPVCGASVGAGMENCPSCRERIADEPTPAVFTAPEVAVSPEAPIQGVVDRDDDVSEWEF